MDFGFSIISSFLSFCYNLFVHKIPQKVKASIILGYKRVNMPIISIVLILLLTIISFNATFQGFISLFEGIGRDKWTAFWTPLILTVIIQLSILLSVWSLKESPLFSKPVWLLIYVMVVMISVGFGYTFWFNQMRAEDFANEISENTLYRVADPVQIFLAGYSEIEGTFTQISEESERLASEEKNAGGTCHRNVPKGPGQMMKYRLNDSDKYKQLAKLIKRKRKRIEASKEILFDSFKKLSTDRQRKRLSEFVNSINAIYSPEKEKLLIVNALKESIERANTKVRSKLVVNGKTSYQEVPLCELDIPKKERFLRVLGNLTFPKAPNTDNIILIDTTNKRTVLNYAFAGIFINIAKTLGVINLFPIEEKTKILYKFSFKNFLPLVLGLIVDLLILLFTVRKSRFNPAISDLAKAINILPEELTQELGRFFGKKDGFRQTLQELLNSTSVQKKLFPNLGYRFKRYLIIPSNIKNGEKSDLFIVASILDFFHKEGAVTLEDYDKSYSDLDSQMQRSIQQNRKIYGRNFEKAFYLIYSMDFRYYSTLIASLIIDEKNE